MTRFAGSIVGDEMGRTKKRLAGDETILVSNRNALVLTQRNVVRVDHDRLRLETVFLSDLVD